MKKLREQTGLTVLELFIVVSVIGMLALAATAGFRRMTVRARRTEVKLALASMHGMMEMHYSRRGTYATLDNGVYFGDYNCPKAEPGWTKQIGFELVSCPQARYAYTIETSDHDGFIIVAEGGADQVNKVCSWLPGGAQAGPKVIDRWTIDEYGKITHDRNCQDA